MIGGEGRPRIESEGGDGGGGWEVTFLGMGIYRPAVRPERKERDDIAVGDGDDLLPGVPLPDDADEFEGTGEDV